MKSRMVLVIALAVGAVFVASGATAQLVEKPDRPGQVEQDFGEKPDPDRELQELRTRAEVGETPPITLNCFLRPFLDQGTVKITESPIQPSNNWAYSFSVPVGDCVKPGAEFRLWRIPAEGDNVEIEGFTFTVGGNPLMLVAEGEEYERRGDLRRATESYKKAAQLDSLSRPVQLALARVDKSATEQAFRNAMSEGMAALERKDYETARKAFRQANAIKPNQPGIADGLARVEEGQRLDTISQHREKARAFEEQEGWRQASEQYQKVLDLDATVQFAQLGKQETDERADLSDRLDFHIKNPERLSDGRVLEEAVTILDSAESIEPAGPKLQQQITSLGEVVAKMSVPMRVELVSDGMTEVVIYRVTRLGTFERRRLDLRPGTYTVVGTRNGYRDVRLELTVVAGKEPEPLVVRCKEKI